MIGIKKTATKNKESRPKNKEPKNKEKNMASLISCEICMEFFDEKKRIPKSLRCGHTLCSLCLPNIGGCCPICYQKVPTSPTKVPTNFSLLSLLGKNINQPQKEDIEKHAKELKEMLLTKKGVIEGDLVKLEHILSAEGCCSMSNQEKKDLLKEIKERNPGVNEMKVEDCQYILLESFESTYNFLNHIKHLLLEDRKKVFACHQVRGDLKYGEIIYMQQEVVLNRQSSSWEKLIVMKSLSEAQAEEGAAVVWYFDLQKCFTHANFSICLIFRYKNKEEQSIFFRPIESRFLRQLIHFCTGDRGPTYKGANVYVYRKRDNMEVSLMKYVVDGVPTYGSVDPLGKVVVPTLMNRADVPDGVQTYVEANEEGQLRIFDGTKNKANEVRDGEDVVFYSLTRFGIGREEFEDNLVDCGIAIKH